MKLNTPDPKCVHCQGKGLRARDLHLVINGQALPNTTKVALHCGCLSPELKVLHEWLDKTPILKSWPWDELKDLRIPRAKDGLEPELLGCPFPSTFAPPPSPKPSVARATPKPAPKKEEPAPVKPKRRGRSKG